MARFASLPLIVLLMGLGSLVMLIPAMYGWATDDLDTSRDFLYSAILFFVLFCLIAIATSNYVIRRQGRSHLISLVAFFLALPMMLAVPIAEAVPDIRFFDAYFEMVSSLTTTGFTLFEASSLPDTVHLWRALVGWLGGFFIWVTAIAILAPLNLGGFEVASPDEPGKGASVGLSQIDRIAHPSERLVRFAVKFFPIYSGLTLALWIGLILAGDRPLVAICHAMSTLATSGISPVAGPAASGSGIAGEVLIFVFFVFALSRLTFSSEDRSDGWRSLKSDPELRLGLSIISVLPVLIFFRHWVATFEGDTVVAFQEGLEGLWGSAFTVASFLTTTGFESAEWGSARAWSGLTSPGVILLGIALFGGGVATTAGGVKLLRVYALYKHGMREMEKLVQPSSIGGAGQAARRFRRQGAYVAWIFFMLFAISIAVVSIALAALGSDFEEAMVMTIASLSTTGPLVTSTSTVEIAMSELGGAAKTVLIGAMVLGRLETLAIIALLNPEFWR